MKKQILSFLLFCSGIAMAQTNPNMGLVAHYPFNGNANDQTSFANHGVVSGAVLDTAKDGTPNAAYRFTTGNRIKVDSNAAFNFSGYNKFTFSAWFNATGLNAQVSEILSFYKQGGIELQIIGSGVDAGKLRLLNYNGITMSVQFDLRADTAVTLNRWNHVLVEFDQTDSTTKMYLNNRLCGQIKNKIFTLPNAGLVIGNHLTTNWNFFGRIDEVRIYNRLLTAAEKAELAGMALSDLIAHYPFTGNANDQTIYANHGTVLGANLDNDKTGSANGSYRFASGEKIKVDTNPTFNFVNFNHLTMSAWFNATAINSQVSEILSFYKQGGIELQIIGSGADAGKLRLLNYNGMTMSVQFDLRADAPISMNQWNHVLVEMNQLDSTTKMYLNNRLCAQIKNKIFMLPNAGLVIGNHLTESWNFIGKLDEIRVYKKLLTASERAALAGQVNTGLTSFEKNKTQLTLFPNPVDNKLHLFLEDEKQQVSRVVVMNVLGQDVLNMPYSSEIDLGTLTSGIYYVNLTSETGELLASQKMVKN